MKTNFEHLKSACSRGYTVSSKWNNVQPLRTTQFTSGFEFNQLWCAKLIFFMLFGLFWTIPISAQVDVQNNVQNLAAKAGIIGNVTPFLSFRATTETFYALPDGKSIRDFDDYDKVWMEPSFSDEQVIQSLNNDGELISFLTVIDPSRQFRPQVYPYKHIVIGSERTTFLDQNNEVIYFLLNETGIKEPAQEPNDQKETTFLDRIGFSDAVLVSLEGSVGRYEGDGYNLSIDSATGLVSITYSDFLDGKETKLNMLFDLNDPERIIPEYEMMVVNETLRSGECVFRVEMTSYTSYTDLSKGSAKLAESFSALQVAAPVEIKVWPNPAINILYLESSGWSSEGVTVWLMGLDGKLLIQQNFDSAPTLRLDTSHIPAGTYILRAISGDQIYTSKIIIQ